MWDCLKIEGKTPNLMVDHHFPFEHSNFWDPPFSDRPMFFVRLKVVSHICLVGILLWVKTLTPNETQNSW